MGLALSQPPLANWKKSLQAAQVVSRLATSKGFTFTGACAGASAGREARAKQTNSRGRRKRVMCPPGGSQQGSRGSAHPQESVRGVQHRERRRAWCVALDGAESQ